MFALFRDHQGGITPSWQILLIKKHWHVIILDDSQQSLQKYHGNLVIKKFSRYKTQDGASNHLSLQCFRRSLMISNLSDMFLIVRDMRYQICSCTLDFKYNKKKLITLETIDILYDYDSISDNKFWINNYCKTIIS